MRFDELTATEIPGPRALSPSPDWLEISGLAYDSRKARPGSLFFCVSGHERDGHDFASAAVSAGAVALVAERPLGLRAPELLVGSARTAMGPFAARFHGDPTAELHVVGVTGTNGKTTTAHLLRALLEAGGERCGLLGTVDSLIAGSSGPRVARPPRRSICRPISGRCWTGGSVSARWRSPRMRLRCDRTDGTRFAAAIFTNLTQDHLDFHPTMEDYFQAKRRLFVAPGDRPARRGGRQLR